MAAAAIDSARYDDLCRLCATKTNMVLGINIFGNEAELRQIYKKIETCLPVQILEGDELPKMICENCLYKLELLYDFRERSLRTEGLLIDLFKEISTLQLEEQQMKLDVVAPLDHQELVMVQASTNNLLNDIDLTHLTEGRDNMIILAPQIDSSLHENADNLLQYHQEHQILTEQYSLSDINLVENNLQDATHETDVTHQSQHDIHETLINNKINDDENEDRLLIDENLMPSEGNSLEGSGEEKSWLFCNLCGKTFLDKDTFQVHYDTHFNKCDVCAAVFSNSKALNVHRKEAHCPKDELIKEEEPPVIAKLEEQESDQENNVDEPEEEEPVEEEQTENTNTTSKKKKWSPKVCTECGKTYKTNYKLTEHMRKHTGEQPYKCRSCDKAFRSKIGLAQHEAKHTGQYDYSCLTCGKGFQCKSYLMVHQRVHSDVKPFPCTTCGRNFKTKQSLLDHTNRHLGLKPYICDICGRSFITNGLCKAHKKVHSGTDNRKYSCKICNKMFVSKSYLQTHTRIHTGEKPFMCEVCGKGFVTRVDLKIHSTMHTGEKSYVCEMCGKAFARRDALRCHRRSHTGERPYSCDICGHTFTQFSPMVIHRRLHTGERPYECEVCGKKFVSRSTMMVHSKKHTR